jgi:hypothetical protein
VKQIRTKEGCKNHLGTKPTVVVTIVTKEIGTTTSINHFFALIPTIFLAKQTRPIEQSSVVINIEAPTKEKPSPFATNNHAIGNDKIKLPPENAKYAAIFPEAETANI